MFYWTFLLNYWTPPAQYLLLSVLNLLPIRAERKQPSNLNSQCKRTVPFKYSTQTNTSFQKGPRIFKIMKSLYLCYLLSTPIPKKGERLRTVKVPRNGELPWRWKCPQGHPPLQQKRNKLMIDSRWYTEYWVRESLLKGES